MWRLSAARMPAWATAGAPPRLAVVRDAPACQRGPALVDEDDSLARPGDLHPVFDDEFRLGGPAVHGIDDGVGSHLAAKPAGALVELGRLAERKQGPFLDGLDLDLFGGGVGVAGPMDPAVFLRGDVVLAGLAGGAGDDLVVVLVGVQIQATVSCLRLLRQAARCPCSRARLRAGIRMAMRMAMTAMTTSSSINVNPLSRFMISPLRLNSRFQRTLHAAQALSGGTAGSSRCIQYSISAKYHCTSPPSLCIISPSPRRSQEWNRPENRR